MCYVLIAEDDPNALMGIQHAVELLGLVVQTATDGGTALEMALAQKPDVMLLDVAMPVKNGLEVTRAVKAHYGADAPKILLVSAYGQRSEIEEGLLAGADDYITKPFPLGELLERVWAAVNGTKIMPSNPL